MSEKKIYQILDLCLWILNPLLIVLAIYDQQILSGILMEWMGKMHPLALHFPIVFGILISIYFLFFQSHRFPINTEKLLLSINALSASIVAIFGILLSLQNAYENEIINLHKWGGIAVAILSWLFIYILNSKAILLKIISILFLIVLIGSTHKGAQLTHGVNALKFPQKEKIKTDVEDNDTISVFQAAIAPIFNQKCISCHGPDKVKGKLRLDSKEYIKKGGESGNILMDNSSKIPILLETIHLPISDDRHMPPDGKLQLTSDETTILRMWIKSGSSFKLQLNELEENDSLSVLINKYVSAINEKAALQYDLPELDEFNTNYCTTNYLFNGSDKIEVNFYQGSFYNRESLQKLEKIKSQIVSLNMQGMPLKNEDLDIIKQFNNLQKVNLNSTGLDIQMLEVLKSLEKLREVSICGIEFNESELDKFLDQSKFSTLHIWLQSTDKKQLEKTIVKYPDVKIIVGENFEDEILKISNPSIVQDSSIFSNQLEVKLKHLLKGVTIKFSTDGSNPDSLLSKEYTNPIFLSENTVLKIKAFKPGWISSDAVQRTFYKSEIQPDTIFLLTDPHPKYRNDGAKTLVDFELGENNISNGEWVTYKDYDMEFVVGFNEPKILKSTHFNAFVDVRAHIFPINSITVLGSNDGKEFENIAETSFPLPRKSAPRTANKYSINFPESTSFKYYKFIVSNTKKMPEWHEAKGKSAWIFIDELFLN